MTLRVSLDVSAVPDRPAGAGRYIVELSRALAQRDDVELVLLSRRDDAARWTEVAPGAEIVPAAPRRRPMRLVWEQVALPGLLRRLGVAVHHGPHYTMPERSGVPVVVTVHDCTYFDHPEWHERSKVVVFRRAIRVAASRAAEVICVSEETAARFRSHCRPRAPVSVVPHGVDHARFRADEPVHGADERCLQSLGLRSPYIAFVGTIEPRKDVPTLVAAFDRVAGDNPELELVLAGGTGWGTAAADTERAVAASRHAGRIRRTGYLPDDVVPAVLRRASVVAYPSLEEGFGLPALEALACGAPLVTTAGSAMAALAGGAATLVPPGDAAELAAALSLVLGSPPARSTAVAVASGYTWEATAEAHVRAYGRAAGRLVP